MSGPTQALALRPPEVLLELPEPLLGLAREPDTRVGGPERVPVDLGREQGRDVLSSLHHARQDLPQGRGRH